MEAIYHPSNVTPAFQLDWGLTIFWRKSMIQESEWRADLASANESSGIRIIKHRALDNETSQFFISTKPDVSPSEIIRGVKGRLQSLVRSSVPKAFQRNYCLRSIGSARRSVVEDYVASQLGHHQMADPRVQEMLQQFQLAYPEVDLSQPSRTAHGLYWYNLHLVFVNDGRWMETRESEIRKLCEMIEHVAFKGEHRLSRLSLLCDHVHLVIGCKIDPSPEGIALGFLNSGAIALGMKPQFKFGYYAGTTGEYDLGAV